MKFRSFLSPKGRTLSTLSRSLLPALFFSALFTACGDVEVGDYYKQGDVEGIVLTLTDEGAPDMLLSVIEAVDLNADSARIWGASLGEGWRLPSKEEMAVVAGVKRPVNITLEKKGLPLVLKGNTYYWTATESGPRNVYACGPEGIRGYFQLNHSSVYRARAIRYLEQHQNE